MSLEGSLLLLREPQGRAVAVGAEQGVPCLATRTETTKPTDGVAPEPVGKPRRAPARTSEPSKLVIRISLTFLKWLGVLNWLSELRCVFGAAGHR
jgi:hypothetical protein